eukprot:1224708-Prymnesium_polylepis.2
MRPQPRGFAQPSRHGLEEEHVIVHHRHRRVLRWWMRAQLRREREPACVAEAPVLRVARHGLAVGRLP